MKFSKYIIWTESTMINECFQLFRQNLSLLNAFNFSDKIYRFLTKSEIESFKLQISVANHSTKGLTTNNSMRNTMK